MNLTLQLGQTVEQVVVTGEAPPVDVTNSSLGGTVHQEQLAELPLNGRNYIVISDADSDVGTTTREHYCGRSDLVLGKTISVPRK